MQIQEQPTRVPEYFSPPTPTPVPAPVAVPIQAQSTREQLPVALEEVVGCTNSQANNYNQAATQEDGSCSYQVHVSSDEVYLYGLTVSDLEPLRVNETIAPVDTRLTDIDGRIRVQVNSTEQRNKRLEENEQTADPLVLYDLPLQTMSWPTTS
jgi:hypothetical protein